jgi:hypothetical protein
LELVLHAARAPDFYLDNRMHGSMSAAGGNLGPVGSAAQSTGRLPPTLRRESCGRARPCQLPLARWTRARESLCDDGCLPRSNPLDLDRHKTRRPASGGCDLRRARNLAHGTQCGPRRWRIRAERTQVTGGRAVGGDDRPAPRQCGAGGSGAGGGLPFAVDSFDAAMAVLSDHHWHHRQRGFDEIKRR